MHTQDIPALLGRIAELEAQVAELQHECEEAAFGNYLAGFSDGEGCLAINKQSDGYGLYTVFQIALRADDRPILEEFHRRTGLGRVIYSPRAEHDRGAPRFTWVVSHPRDCMKLVELFDRYPLRAKKAKDYELWRLAVIEKARVRCRPQRGERDIGPKRDWSHMMALRDALMNGRRYDRSFEPLPSSPPPQLQLENL